MKKIGLSIIAIMLIAFTSCKEEKKDAVKDVTKTEEVKKSDTNKKESISSMNSSKKSKVDVRLESKSGSEAEGKMVFTEENGEVSLDAKFRGLSPGKHAIHIHEKADCSSEDGKSAGGHWNPTFQNHGKWGDENGYHKGDIGNIEVDKNGYGKISMKTDEWCIGCDDENKNILGKAIIVHQGTDDFVTQPTGAAGARVSCGGIIQ